MEELIARFPHIAEQIFQQLNNKSLTNCQEVSKSWLKFIDDNRNMSWIRILEIPRMYVPGCTNNTYLHIAATTGQSVIFEMMFEDEEYKNPRNRLGQTPFMLACQHGNLKIAWIILQKAVEFNIDLNSQDKNGKTAYHWACQNGQSKVIY